MLTERNRLITAGSRVRLRLATDERLVACVRRGDTAAFEVIYERHAHGLLSFCIYMLRSRHDAEDAVQATFVSAYRALLADRRPVELRPWLFAIARNDCLSILRTRRPTVELNGEPALGGDPLGELELREEVRHMLESLHELPEAQRAALVLAEMHGLSQAEIGAVLGVEAAQVKAYIYQARSNLISDRQAREVDCREIREELATARGAALLRGRLRRHLRACEDCRVYADGVARQRRHLGALLPLAPSLLLKYRALEDALGIGGADPATYAGGATVAGTAAEIAGGGIKALAVKMAAGAAVLGATAGVGASVLSGPATPGERTSASTTARPSLLASAETSGWSQSGAPLAGRTEVDGSPTKARSQDGQPSTPHTGQGSPAGGGVATEVGSPGNASKEPGASAQERQPGQSEGHTPKSRVQPPESQEERQKKSEAHEHGIQERRKESEEDEQESDERQKQSEEDKQRKSEERKRKSEERKRRSEERAHEREERQRVGRSRPPRSKEEREREREERLKHHEEREQRRRERREGK